MSLSDCFVRVYYAGYGQDSPLKLTWYLVSTLECDSSQQLYIDKRHNSLLLRLLFPSKLIFSLEHKTSRFAFQSNLPHVINPIESKLGTSTTNDINLIIYLMEDKYSPLHIKTVGGEMKQLPSFLSPQFGAVLLYDTRLALVIKQVVTSQFLMIINGKLRLAR